MLYSSELMFTFVTMELTERITHLIHHQGLSSSQFADEIGVQRSSMSHILSGRNKPSLDFVQKILKRYTFLHTDWLLFGKEPMTKEIKQRSLFDPEVLPNKAEVADKSSKQPESDREKVPANTKETEKPGTKGKEVAFITIFYTDGSCTTFNHNSTQDI